MALDRLTKVDGGGISTTSDYRVGIITASKFVGPFDGSGGNFSGVVTATSANFTGNVTIGGTLTYEDVTNIDSVGIITARQGVRVTADGSNSANYISVGANNDLQLFHNGSNSHIRNNTGILVLNADSLLIQSLSETYLSATANGAVRLFYDNSQKMLTSSTGINVDFRIAASGDENTYVNLGNPADQWQFYTGGVDRLFITGGPSDGGTVQVRGDNNKLQIGASQDLQLFHQGGTSIIKDINDNPINIQSDGEIKLAKDGNAETYARFIPDGAVELYHNNSKKLETTSNGTEITGKVQVLNNGATASSIDGTVDIRSVGGSALLVGSTNAGGALIKIDGGADGDGANGDYVRIRHMSNGVCYFDNLHTAREITFRQRGDVERLKITSVGHIEIPADNAYLRIGASADLELFHDNNGDSYITNDTGHLTIRNNTSGKVINLQPKSGANGVIARYEGAVELYHDNSKKFETTSSGGTLTGSLTVTDDIFLSDANVAYFGTNNDMRIYHSGTHGYIKNTVNNLYIMTTNSKYGALLYANAGVELRYDNVKKFETTSAGASIAGDLSITGNIGSTSAEIGDVYLANSKKVYFGSTQTLSIHNDGSNSLITDSSSAMFVRSNRILFQNSGGTEGYGEFNQNGSVYWTHDNIKRIETTATGIEVTGEVAASQDYPNFRPTIDFNFAAEKKLDPRITYRRLGAASFVNEFGKIVLIGANEPRFDHDPTTRECKGLLIEESRTNFVRNSLGLGSGWVAGSGSFAIDNSITNPDGSVGAYYHTGAELYHQDIDLSGASTNTVIVSLWIKERSGQSGVMDIQIYQQISGSVVVIGAFSFNPATAVISTPGSNFSNGTVEEYPNGWYRVSAKVTTSSGNFTSSTRYDIQGAEHYVWGFQMEVGEFLTSFIPTNGSTATRGKDLAEIEGEDFTDFFNQTEGTINCAYWLGNDNTGMRVFQINDGANSVIDIVAGSGSGTGGYGYVNTGGVAQATVGQSSTNANYLNKLHVVTLAYKENDIAAINKNTGVLTTDTSATLDGAYNQVTFYQHTNSGDQLNGHLQRVQYYPKRLPNNQLKNLNNQ